VSAYKLRKYEDDTRIEIEKEKQSTRQNLNSKQKKESNQTCKVKGQ